MNGKFNIIDSFLLRSAGADLHTISLCPPSEISKYKLIGVSVLVPTVLAFLTGGYAVYKISDNVIASILIAPVWAWIIYTIDKSIVANTNSSKLNGKIVSRFILAIFISFLISQPMELLIFRDVITEKRNYDLASNIDMVSQPINISIDSLNNLIALERENVSNRRDQFIQEVLVGDKESGRPGGYGPVAEVLDRELKADSIVAERVIFDYKATITGLKEDLADKAGKVEDSYPTGILGDLELLYALADESVIIRRASYFFLLFFLILELIPIIIKIGSLGKSGDIYTKVKIMKEEECLQSLTRTSNERKEQLDKEQILLVNKRIQKIDLEIEKEKVKESARNHSFYIKTIKSTSEEINHVESEIAKRIKNEAVREHLLAQLLKVYFNFSSSIEELINKIAVHYKEKK